MKITGKTANAMAGFTRRFAPWALDRRAHDETYPQAR
jgi:hypothetical protein